MKQTDSEKYALSLLPSHISAAVYDARDKRGLTISEIRIRANRQVTITANGENIPIYCTVTKDEVGEIAFALCGKSLYAHADTINKGFISLEKGVRVGICGHAVADGEKVSAVRDFTSLSIRIPRRFPESGKIISDVFSELRGMTGIIVYSPPGVGKTTALREFSASDKSHRIAVVDTRCELGFAAEENPLCDVLEGYPRDAGIEAALRSLTPDVIVCDEIGNASDSDAIRSSGYAGVPIIASCHGIDADELINASPVSECISRGMFGALIGLKRTSDGIESEVRYLK